MVTPVKRSAIEFMFVIRTDLNGCSCHWIHRRRSGSAHDSGPMHRLPLMSQQITHTFVGWASAGRLYSRLTSMLPFTASALATIYSRSESMLACLYRSLLDNRVASLEPILQSSFKDIYCSSFWCADQIDIQSVAVPFSQWSTNRRLFCRHDLLIISWSAWARFARSTNALSSMWLSTGSKLPTITSKTHHTVFVSRRLIDGYLARSHYSC